MVSHPIEYMYQKQVHNLSRPEESGSRDPASGLGILVKKQEDLVKERQGPSLREMRLLDRLQAQGKWFSVAE